MLSKKQEQILHKAKHLQAKFAESLIATKGNDIKEKVIKSGYALCDNSDELLEVIKDLKDKVKKAKDEASSAVHLMQTKGRQLRSLEKRLSHR